MRPGFYAARLMPSNSRGDSLRLESMPFDPNRVGREEALRRARDWADFVKSTKPKAEIFVIEVLDAA